MPVDEVNLLPHPLTVSGAAGSTYPNPPGFEGDYSIAGIEFLTAASDETPYQRQLAKQVKDQFDNSANPGDNSLQGWWVRSQTDWSQGAGQEIMEPINDDAVSRRFHSSAGVDVFTRLGYVSLLPAADEVATPWTASGPDPIIVKTSTGYVVAVGDKVYRWNGTAWSASMTAAGSVTGLTIAGPYCLVSSINNVQYFDVSAATPSLASAFTCTGYPRTWWLKSRILIAVGDKIYEHAGSNVTGGPVALTGPVVDLKDTSLSVTGMTTTPQSILFSTFSSSGSVIMAIVLDANGALPTTAAPVVAAEFPGNEEIHDIQSYLGTFVGIATSEGVRIATASNNGGIVYGPLIGSPVISTTASGSASFSAYDRFLQYPTDDAGDGRSGLIRIDLSGLGEDGRAPWSTWCRVPAGDGDKVMGHLTTGERSALLLTTGGCVLYTCEDANGPEPSGWILHSLVRYGTLETKVYDTVRITTEAPLSGSVTVATVSTDGSLRTSGVVTPASGAETTLRVNQPKALSGLSVKVTLAPLDGVGPVLAAWTLRAYPAVSNRSELVVLPLLNFDFEKDEFGMNTGYEGRAWERYRALRDRMAEGTKMMVKERNSGASYLALPQDMSFQQIAPGNRASGFGGVINVVLRTLT